MMFQKNQNKFLYLKNIFQKNENILITAIILLSFVVKLLFYKFLSQPSFYDVQTYTDTVMFFLNGEPISDQIMPLYPIIVYFVQMHIGIEIFNILISCLTVYVVFELSKLIYKDIFFRFLVALVISFYPFNIFYSITGFSEVIYVFLLTLMLLSFYKNKIFIATIIGTLAILIKPIHFYPLFILIFYFDFFYFKKKLKKSFSNLIIGLIIFVSIMSPWWIYNYTQYDKFIMFNLVGPHTLFIGNNPLNETGGGVMIDEFDIKNHPKRFFKIQKDFSYDLLNGYPGFYFDKERNKVEFISGNKAALDRYNSYLQYSVNYILNNPIRFIELSYKKFIRFWRLWPYSQEYNQSKYFYISLLTFGPILCLFALYSLKFIRNFEKKTFPLILMIYYFNFIHMILISSIRYRYPIENYLIILGIYFLVCEFNKSLKEKSS